MSKENEKRAVAQEKEDANRDPITGASGSHPVGTGIGATGGAIAGAAIGTVAGPIGAAVGLVAGASLAVWRVKGLLR
jgi:phage tail tape-measure protein